MHDKRRAHVGKAGHDSDPVLCLQQRSVSKFLVLFGSQRTHGLSSTGFAHPCALQSSLARAYYQEDRISRRTGDYACFYMILKLKRSHRFRRLSEAGKGPATCTEGWAGSSTTIHESVRLCCDIQDITVEQGKGPT